MECPDVAEEEECHAVVKVGMIACDSVEHGKEHSSPVLHTEQEA
jgi:hypothetical protein